MDIIQALDDPRLLGSAVKDRTTFQSLVYGAEDGLRSDPYRMMRQTCFAPVRAAASFLRGLSGSLG